MDVRPAPPSCLALIHEFEQGPGGGFAPIHYLDPAGVPTIGWGHRIKPEEQALMFTCIGQDKADALADSDLAEAAGAVCRQFAGDVVAGLSEGQYAALVDLVFNIGEGQFSGSTVHHLIGSGQLGRVPAEIERWVYAKGRFLPGLQKRRLAEVALWSLDKSSGGPAA